MGLLVVLPGGECSVDFHPFVRHIPNNAPADNLKVVQPQEKKRTKNQVIVWRACDNAAKMEYATKGLVDNVIAAVREKAAIDPERID